MIPWKNADPLMDGRKKIAVPHLRAAIGGMLAEDDIRRQIGVERAQAEAEPGPDAGQGDRGRTGVHRQHRLKMLDDVGVQAADHAQFVGHARQMRKQLADRQARLAVTREAERRRHQGEVVDAPQMDGRDAFAVVDRQAGLRIERVDMRKAAGEKDEDELLGPRRVVRPPGCQRMSALQLGRQRERTRKLRPARSQPKPGQFQKITASRTGQAFHNRS